MMFRSVLALAMSLSRTPCDRGDPDVDVVRERLAQGVVEATAVVEWPGQRAELAALMFTVGKHESHFAVNIQAGRCRKHQCAGGRARSWWQHERVFLESERWDAIVGLSQEAISQAAILTAERLRSARYQCADADDVIRATLKAYATSRCDGALPDEDARVATFNAIRRRL